MTDGIPINDALAIAHKVFTTLEPVALGRSLVGAARRGDPLIKRIEFLIEPKSRTEKNLLGDNVGFSYDTNAVHDSLASAGIAHLSRTFEKFTGRLGRGLTLWVHIHRYPAQWGINLIRFTGPKNFSKWAMTPRKSGGALPSFATYKPGAVYRGKKIILMPDEPTVFAFLGVEYTAPGDRDSELPLTGSGGAMPYGTKKLEA